MRCKSGIFLFIYFITLIYLRLILLCNLHIECGKLKDQESQLEWKSTFKNTAYFVLIAPMQLPIRHCAVVLHERCDAFPYYLNYLTMYLYYL